MELLQHRRVKVFSYSCLSLFTDHTIYRSHYLQITLSTDHTIYRSHYLQIALSTDRTIYRSHYLQITLSTDYTIYRSHYLQIALSTDRTIYRSHYLQITLSTDHTIYTPSLHHSYLILRADKYIIICCKYLLLSPDNQQHKGTSSDKHYRFYLTSICR